MPNLLFFSSSGIRKLFLLPILCLLAGPLLAQDLTINGKVFDSVENQPLPGVTIQIKNTAKGTVTDASGAFSVAVAKGQVLVFSYIGYEALSFTVDNNTAPEIRLNPQSNNLNEVAVVGYGTQKKVSLTGAVSSINATNLKNQVTKNVMDAIAGQIAGVQVTSATGIPGAPPVIRIRGTGSISAGNEPLYVVDGLPFQSGSDLNTINPNDIETMDVLKDASAQAIYGSRGSNGVVLITTKKGKVGQARIDFNYYTGFQNVPKLIDVLDRDGEIKYWKETSAAIWAASGGDPNVPNGSRVTSAGSKAFVNYLEAYDDPSSLPNTNWQKEVFRTAPTSNYQLSVRGGSEKIRYFLSGNYFSGDGVVKATDWKRYTARLNVDASPTSFFRVGMSLSPSYTKENRRWTDGSVSSPDNDVSVVMTTMVLPSSIAPKTADGLYDGTGGRLNIPYTTVGWAAANNPLQPLEDPNYKFVVEKSRITGITYAELEPVKGLVLRTDFGLDRVDGITNKYRPSTVSSYTNQVRVRYQPLASPITIFSSQENLADITLSWNNTLTWQKTFSNVHDINFMAGYTYQKGIYENSNLLGAAGSYQNDAVKYVSGAATINGSASKSQWTLLSYLSRLNYAYKEKYLLSASVRRDGSSRFGRNNKFALFPAASIGWRISEEAFLKNVSFLQELKLRVGYGKTGNFNIGNYTSIPQLGTDNYNFGSALAVGYAPISLSNDELSWETNKTIDAGMDIGLFRNRLNINFDFYRRVTDNLLYNLPIPSISGFTTAISNIGKVENKGFEISLNSVNIKSNGFTWTSNLNFSRNRNTALSLGKNNLPITSFSLGNYSMQRIEVGKPLSYFYGYKLGGIFRDQADVDAHPEMRLKNASGQLIGAPGDSKIVDLNGDGVITPDDRTEIGNPSPDFTYGISNHLSYKAFDLDVQLQGVQGNDVLFFNALYIGSNTLVWNQLTESVENRWKSPSEPGNGIYARAEGPTAALGNAETRADRFTKDASYLRIRNVTLGYNVPSSLLKRVHLNSLRIYSSVQNLHTFTKYMGYNPDVSVNGESVTLPGIDFGGYPLARTFTFGVNIGL
ncbi:TonB-dependent receptor P3 [Dyadobacter sp. CECT 9275]|uniref:TonB-dependent receptor P3 n=1 Tax=Dyadobacter helix TaxID=2822344 RepID=A0A916NLE1_9BACT|nr:TonB-dependent receptor [Dyadobacter sp. CECT 9275]CAG5000226.1 TonB-dependent receptor P3 [Dyadobacter sp. CECT 9275]